jgi:hypothetical protein
MFDDKCREEYNKKLIVCEENQTKITFRNTSRVTVEKIRIDGCVITNNAVKKCDYLLLCAEKKKAIFVELKGNKVKTAIEQLSATLDNEIVKEPLAQYTKRAYAVVTKIPALFQNAQEGFNKKYKGECTLIVVTSSHTYDLLSGKPTT